MGSLTLLLEIFPIHQWNLGLLHCRWILYQLSYEGSPYMQSTSCKMLGWMKLKLESKLPGEISITSDMQMISPLWQKAKRKGTEEPHDESERGSEKVGLKLNI